MDWNLFDGWIDATLYRQMMEMIYRSCSMKDKSELDRENRQYELFPDHAEKKMEEEYGLHYPGEVLERLEEHREVGEAQMRALGLALAKTKNLQESSMFIGNQLPVFWRKLNRALKKDALFLSGIRYLMDGKTDKGSYEALLGYPFRTASEMAFALFILPQDDGLWDKIKDGLNRQLGKERHLSVYDNPRLYIWLVQNFQFRVKGYRRKDLDALKYLMRLPFCNAFGKTNTTGKKLLENGYGRDEILFLNCLMIQEVSLLGRVSQISITGEKIAVEVCRYFLDAEKEYPEAVYQLCSKLCTLYSSFQIRISGFEGMSAALRDVVTAKHAKAFRTLYPLTKKVRNWKRIDLTDSKWDVIYSWLSKKEYDECVQETLEELKDTGKLMESLKHYEELTGQEYSRRFWEEESIPDQRIFRHLASYGVLPVVRYTEQFLDAYREDGDKAKKEWKELLWYLHDYVHGLQSHEAYVILDLFVKEFGITGLKELFEITPILKELFTKDYSRWSYMRNSHKLEFFRPFLSAEEHRQVFLWIDEFVFRNDTEHYFEFLKQFLAYKDHLLWFPKEEARETFFCLQKNLGEGQMKGVLRELYLTEDEQNELRSRERLIEERKMLKKRLDAIKDMKRMFTETVSRSRLQEGQFRVIQTFINAPFLKKEAEKSAASYLRSLLAKERICLHTRDEMGELFQLLSQLYGSGALELETVKEFTCKMEELQNEETDTETYTNGE